jgi:hypothetical protein
VDPDRASNAPNPGDLSVTNGLVGRLAVDLEEHGKLVDGHDFVELSMWDSVARGGLTLCVGRLDLPGAHRCDDAADICDGIGAREDARV